ncbi:MAG: DUF1553 domain-containing protein [Acidobacteria bacterium]|nr:DUF1553 domain-containing protein [Acidobacteriota bacterium]
MQRILRFAALVPVAAALGADTPEEHFEKRVRPSLVRHCQACHGPDKQFAGLRLDSRAAILKGGRSGAAAIPGSPGESLIVRAMRHEGPAMPVGVKLPAAEIEAVAQWVAAGMVWPEAPAKAASGGGFYQWVRQRHWAFQPVRAAAPPAPRTPGWSANPIDRFIAARLEKEGLAPAPSAPSHALARRVSYVLTGLPPRENGPYETQVESLLRSPHFGERWARHWMDVMRYGETYGYEWNYEIHGAWRYRDYLIRAFNLDLPYNQFVREHIAGDLLAKPRLEPATGLNESKLGTTFYRLGEMGHDDCIEFRELRLDVVDNQIDTLSKAFQGLTVACARCHDHKIDPIPTEDYYGLFGILASSRQVTHSLDTRPLLTAGVKQQLDALKAQIRGAAARQWGAGTATFTRYFDAGYNCWRGLPHKEPADLDPMLVNRFAELFRAAKPDESDPMHVFHSLAGGESWASLQARYAGEAEARHKFNHGNFTPWADFRLGPSNWPADGAGLRDGLAADGALAVASEGSTAVEGVLEQGLYTHLYSDKLNGALRSPFLPKDRKFISLRVAGGKLGARRTIVDNCVIGENYDPIPSTSPRWLKLPTLSKEKLPIFLELVTRTDNPRYPDRPGRLRGVSPEQQIASIRSYFGAVEAVLHDVDEAPREDVSPVQRLFAHQAEGFGGAVGAVLRDSLRRWEQGRADGVDARWIEWARQNGLLENDATDGSELARLVREYRAIEQHIPAPQVGYGVADEPAGYDVDVLTGGNPKNPGKTAPRHFLSLLPGGTPVRAGSGRLEMAEMIAGRDNPLTARVMVNRVWHHVFGQSLVSTPDNFGVFGERPVNPELLDYLADWFMREGWSVKKLIRLMVTSQTFRQSAAESPHARLLHHYPVRRLDAEAVRDSILAVSGRLEPSLYGPSIQPYREKPTDYRRLYSGPLDGNGRRSVYLKVTRMETPRFLDTFDFPAPLVPRGARDTTNVAGQALALMNDSFVVAQAQAWAQALLAAPAGSFDTRLTAMFQAALNRVPTSVDRARFEGLARELASLHGVAPDAWERSLSVWRDLAHTVLNLKEFLYLP